MTIAWGCSMNRDETDNESLLEKAKDALTGILRGDTSGEASDTDPTHPGAEPATSASGPERGLGGETSNVGSDAGTGVGTADYDMVDYNQAAEVNSNFSDTREGVAPGDFGIAGQTDAYDGADVMAEEADTPGRAKLD